MVTKGYIDTHFGLKLPKTGDAMHGDLSMGDNHINNLAEGTR